MTTCFTLVATYSTQLNSETARKAGVDAETVFRASCNRSFGSGKAHEVVFTPFEAAPSHTCTGEETHITLFKYGHDVRHEGLHILTCARARCVAKQQKDKTFKYIDNTRKVSSCMRSDAE